MANTQTAERALTIAEIEALYEYALTHGRTWKASLREDWMAARLDGPLHALRNSHGPRWLETFSFKNC